jgi:transposase
MKAILEQAATLFATTRGPKPFAEHKEPKRLFCEIGKLKMELDRRRKKSGLSLPSRAAHGLRRRVSLH